MKRLQWGGRPAPHNFRNFLYDPPPQSCRSEAALEIHGEWQLKAVRDIVISTFSGSWNEEAMLAYFQEYQSAVGARTRYCALVLYADWRGVTPEAAAAGGVVRRWAQAHGCVCEAWVLTDPQIKKWVDLYLRDDDGLHPLRSFATNADAVAWLASQGFPLALDEVPEPPPQ
jgi:hypothetical protein